MNKNKIIPVILCGGTGSRLWPLSRASYPKQYLTIGPGESLTFLQKTIDRIRSCKNIDDPIIICNEEHRFIVAEQIRGMNIKAKAILLEPVGRNTAPAITAASIKIIQDNKDACVLVLPADHIIKDEKIFINAINKALDYVIEGKIVTFGITPDKAETGYGYIESKNELNYEELNGEKIENFIEKPNKKNAMKFIADKKFTWNSGIFFFRSKVFLNEIQNYSPEIYALCEKSLIGNNYDLDFQRLDKYFFRKCTNISVDKAIMEKTNLGIVIPLNAGWSDIGNWDALWDISNKDKLGNVILGKVLTQNVKNSYLRSENKLIAALGLENVIIVETNDAVLVANKNKSQDIKNIVQILKNNNKPEATFHKTIFRPWGNYTSVADGSNWQVKKIIVKSGESLSLQSHKYRTEHWVVVSGTAFVEIEGNENILQKNESIYIPLGSKHRLSNRWQEKLILIEIQSGNYLGEDDITRFEDNYGRK